MRNKTARGVVSALMFTIVLAAAYGALAESAGQYIDDATITTKVKAALVSDPQLKETQVSVETSQGTVQLSGTVGNKDQESEAIKVANKVGGVRAVKDMMAVRGTQSD